jgi:hypothetical protein
MQKKIGNSQGRLKTVKIPAKNMEYEKPKNKSQMTFKNTKKRQI